MTSYEKAKFITFEGGEGSGKSTQSKLLYEHLLSQGIDAILTREIGGTKEAEAIRNLMLHSELAPMSELLLVMAARYEHVHNVIIPALNSGKWVICDRFIDSTACYQGMHKDIGIDMVYTLHRQLISGLMPDITFFIDVSVDIGMQRALKRAGNNKFEDKDLDFHNQVHKGFTQITALFPKRVIRIDANNLSINEVHNEVIRNLDLIIR
jgi:dTMP kinase